MQETPKGQKFFHADVMWVPVGETAEMRETLNFKDEVKPFMDIHGCNDQGQVRFFIAREQ